MGNQGMYPPSLSIVTAVVGLRGRDFDRRLLVQQDADPRLRVRDGQPHDRFARNGPVCSSEGGYGTVREPIDRSVFADFPAGGLLDLREMYNKRTREK